LDQTFATSAMDWRERIRLLQQFLGYGEVQIERCLSSTNQRATLLGWASISEGQGHIFRLPLPPSLSASKELRRLTATLAWITPANHQHKNYRRAQLFMTVPEEEIGTRTIGIDSKSAQRARLSTVSSKVSMQRRFWMEPPSEFRSTAKKMPETLW